MSNRTLIQTVGLGIGPQGLAESLRRSIESIAPDRVIFICTPRSEQESIVPLRQEAPSILGTLSVEIESITEAARSNLTHLVEVMLQRLDHERRQNPEAELHVDFTGGTKPMSAAAVLAAMGRDVPFAHYVEPELGGPDGRVPVGSRKVHRIDLHGPRFDGSLQRLLALFNHGEFVAVVLQCKELQRRTKLTAEQKNKIEVLRSMSQAHADWDRFEWGKALAQFQSMKHAMVTEANWDHEAFQRALGHLDACQRDAGVTIPRAADIHANAGRLLARHRHADGVARLYRLVEYLIQRRFRIILEARGFKADSSNPTSALDRSILERLSPRWTARRIKSDPSIGQRPLGLYDATCVLEDCGDDFGKLVHDRHGRPESPGRLGTLLRARNQSFLAHGSSPIGGKEARALFAESEDLLNRLAQIEGVDAIQLKRASEFVRSPEPFPAGSAK